MLSFAGSIGFPLTASRAMNTNLPPSSAGIGSRLKMPRLMLKMAAQKINEEMPRSAKSPVSLKMATGPPTWLSGFEVVKSCPIPWKVNLIQLYVS
jgi:hypothetical protein